MIEEIDLSLLNFLMAENPPMSLLQSLRHDFKIKNSNVASIIDKIIEDIPPTRTFPSYTTLCTLYSKDIALFKESITCDKIADNLNDYATIYHQESIQSQTDSIVKELEKALKTKDQDKIIQLADELAWLGHQGARRIGPIDEEDFLDTVLIAKPAELLTTHIPRLNQHLGGEPNGIDFETSGGITLGEITVISGSTNRGKSAAATSIWQHFIRESLGNSDYKSVYFNYEGALDRFRKTMFAHITGVYPYKESKFLASAIKEYENFMKARKGNFLLYDAGGKFDIPMNIRSLETEISKLSESGYRAFFIDTINSLDTSSDSSKSWEGMEKVMRTFEALAKRYNIAIICTAQNKQGLEFEDAPWPDVKWIGSSSLVQQKPGTVIGIYRTDIYSGGAVAYTDLALLKLRHRSPYPRESVKVTYDKNRHMLIPYEGNETDVLEASEVIQKKQIVTALKDNDIAVAFGSV